MKRCCDCTHNFAKKISYNSSFRKVTRYCDPQKTVKYNNFGFIEEYNLSELKEAGVPCEYYKRKWWKLWREK